MIPLQKHDSSIVVSTHTYESTVIDAPLASIWHLLRSFSLDKILPSHVEKVDYLENGKEGCIGSVIKIVWKDKAEWKIKITELSDIHHYVSYEVIDTEPQMKTSSMEATIKLYRVTDNNTTFITWETDFPNDADAFVIQDNKYKKLEFFQDIKKKFNIPQK